MTKFVAAVVGFVVLADLCQAQTAEEDGSAHRIIQTHTDYALWTMPAGQDAISHFDVRLDAPTSIKMGSDIQISVTWTNSSQRSIGFVDDFSGGSATTDNQFHVEGPGEHLTEKKPNSSRGGYESRPAEIKPGESKVTKFVVSDLFDMSKPGLYRLQVRNRLEDGSLIKSNLIMVQVTP